MKQVSFAYSPDCLCPKCVAIKQTIKQPECPTQKTYQLAGEERGTSVQAQGVRVIQAVGPCPDNMDKFDTGAQRENKAFKPDLTLISPLFLQRLGMWCTVGGLAHGDRNWEKGIPLHSYLASASRHLNALLEGHIHNNCMEGGYQLNVNPDDHAVALAWNIMCFIHTLEMIDRGILATNLNDLQNYTVKEKSK